MITKKTKCHRKSKALRLNSALLQFAKAIEETAGVQLPICKRKRRPRKLLTTEQAARALGRKKHTMENWRSLGEGPAFHKVGGRVLYNRQDVLNFLNDRKFEHTSAYYAIPLKDGGLS